MTKKTIKAQCVYCREYKEITRDHVISKCLFPEKYEKTNPVIAPSCSDCNSGFSKDEEYFRQFLCPISIEHSKEASDIFYTKVKRSIQRRPQIGYKAMSNMQLVDCYTKGGIYIGQKTKISLPDADWSRYHNVLNKYIKGLFFYEFNTPMPQDHKIKHIFGHRNNRHLSILKHINKWNLDNEKVIVFGNNFIPNTFESIWVTIFFNSVFFITFVVPEDKYNKFENEAKIQNDNK